MQNLVCSGDIGLHYMRLLRCYVLYFSVWLWGLESLQYFEIISERMKPFYVNKDYEAKVTKRATNIPIIADIQIIESPI